MFVLSCLLGRRSMGGHPWLSRREGPLSWLRGYPGLRLPLFCHCVLNVVFCNGSYRTGFFLSAHLSIRLIQMAGKFGTSMKCLSNEVTLSAIVSNTKVELRWFWFGRLLYWHSGSRRCYAMTLRFVAVQVLVLAGPQRGFLVPVAGAPRGPAKGTSE